MKEKKNNIAQIPKYVKEKNNVRKFTIIIYTQNVLKTGYAQPVGKDRFRKTADSAVYALQKTDSVLKNTGTKRV